MKRFLCLFVTLALVVCAAPAALAAENTWNVEFTADERMVSDFNDVGENGAGNAYNALSASMQPGDSVTITMNLKNSYPGSVDWYMSNEIIQSLEATAGVDVAHGGAYTYRLEYVGPQGSSNSRILYDSNRVGGENGALTDAANTEGLEMATQGLEEMLYLDSLGANANGQLLLTVALDGESQGNDYQDTLAKLIMRFAAEPTPVTTTVTQTERHIERQTITNRRAQTTTEIRYVPVKTGDESRLLLWSLVMLGCGLAALVLAVVNHRKDRRERR